MDGNRRKFLKIILVGSGVFLAEKVLSPLFSRFLDDSSVKNNPSDKIDFKDFRVVEDKKGLSICNNSGEEILQIDKGEV